MKNRIGRFKLNLYYKDENVYTYEELFCGLRFVPYRAEYLFAERCCEYTGHSPLFDEIEEGGIIPTYDITIAEVDDTGNFDVSVSRKEAE